MNNHLTRAITDRTLELRALQNPIVQQFADQNPDCTVGLYIQSYSGKAVVTLNCHFGMVDKEVPLEDVADYAYEEGYVLSRTIILHDDEQLTVRLYLSGQKEYTRSEKSLLKAVGKLQTKRVTATRMVCAI